MDVKQATTAKVKRLLKQPYYHALWHKQVSSRSFKSFIAQRCKMATNFEKLLQVGVQAATEIGATKLAAEFAHNLADEQGVDEFGHHNKQFAHKTLRNKFLARLLLNQNSEYFQYELPCVAAHHEYLLQLEQEANAFKIAGAILVIERFVPMEFRAIQTSRDYLFPELFVVDKKDTDLEKKAKTDSCCYIDDHIIHDAKAHYPNLLNAIYADASNEDDIKDLYNGIEKMAELRLNIFNDAQPVIH